MDRLLITYNYFPPAYKGGGPIQSIANLVRNLNDCFEIFVVTSNCDFGELTPLNIEPDTWLDFENGKAKVIYLSNINPIKIREIIYQINPAKIFVNGIYSIPFTIVPVIFFPERTIVHVRGMLHPGALKKKAIKKKIFLLFLILIGISRKVSFCGSDENEVRFTKAVFGENIKIQIAQNYPANFAMLPVLAKHIGSIKLVSIGLISSMKNHLLIIEALSMVANNVTYHIIGPIKDNSYWRSCKSRISQLPKNIIVKYLGEINPNNVYNTLSNYHFFILPSQSENFGHALYESMIAGKPIITSNNTPWNLLEENNAGYNVELTPGYIAEVIDNAALLNQKDYNEKVIAVRKYAELAIDREKVKQQYLNLFV